MKIPIYWLTTELENSGTETELFGTQSLLLARLQMIMEERIRQLNLRALTFPDTGGLSVRRRAAIDLINEALEYQRIARAWELFTEHELQSEDDCVWHGREEVEVPIKTITDALQNLVAQAQRALATQIAELPAHA